MERVWSTSRRGFSARSIFMFVLAVFITALLWVTFGSHTPTHAVDAPAATWKGESILYDGHQYFKNSDAGAGNSLGLAQGTHYYVYTADTNGAAPKIQKAFVIYFAPGTDPPTATTASVVTYDYSSQKVYSQPTDPKTITVTPQGSESSYSSCAIQGIGWIICPITTFLADGMDTIFNIVKGFLVVQPANTTNTNNSLYIAWNMMRSVANVAFIIVFLIIIYSQLTSSGITNYGLKKLLPRLIVGAVLVNLSYLICAAALDISNILGYSLQDVFISIRQNTFNISNDTWSDSAGMGWSAVTALVLSGGAASVGLLVATGGTIAGAIYLLVPVLVGLVLTILFVLLILAARQAIIIILIVIAPLAFVAYLLPNTEQWFKKWRELFMTMLVFFPAFSLVFGGSQLAGGIIIQNATSIITVIFGLAVQVAPLVITPMLLKLSGGLLGRIAGMVNDPRKGLLDRTKNWSGAKADMHRQRGIGGPLKKNQIFRRTARGLAYNNRRTEKQTEQYKAGFEEYGTRRDISSRSGQKAEVETALSKLATEEMHHNMGQAMEELRAGDSSGLRRLRTQGDYSTIETIRTSRVGKILPGGQLTEEEITERREIRVDKDKAFIKYGHKVVERAVELDQSSRVIASATASAQSIQLQKFAKAIDGDIQLQASAGGIDPNGAQRALANAFAIMSKARAETIDNAGKIIDYRNLSNEQVRLLSEGIVAPGVNITLTQDIHAAALKRTLGGPDTEQLALAMRNIDFSFAGLSSDDREELQIIAGEALQSNSARPPEVGAGVIGRMKQGLDFRGNVFTGSLGTGGMNQMIVEAANAQKLDAGKLQTAGKDYSKAIFDMLGDSAFASQLTPEAKARLKAELRTVLDPSREASERLGDSKPFLENIEKLL